MGYARPPAASSEPYHRQWRDAAEDDATVPAEAMAVIGVYARYLASEGGPLVSVSWPEIRHLTHLSTSAISTAHKYLEGHGWLLRQPVPPGGDKRRAYYLPGIGKPGEGRKFRGQASTGHSVPRSDVAPSGGAVSLRPTEQPDYSVRRSDTLRPTERTTADHSVGRSPTIDLEEIDRSSYLEPGSVAELLAQIGVTEDAVAAEIEADLRERGANVPAGLLYHLIQKGEGPGLVRDARKRVVSRDSRTAADCRPAGTPYAALCSRCGQPHGDGGACAARTPDPAPSPPESPPEAEDPETPCAAGDDCRQRHTSPRGRDYHEACEVFRDFRAARRRALAGAGCADPQALARVQADESRAEREAS